jgi:hypothetical protein
MDSFFINQARNFYATTLREVGNQTFIFNVSIEYRRIASLKGMNDD